jgi:hypothetical protein
MRVSSLATLVAVCGCPTSCGGAFTAPSGGPDASSDGPQSEGSSGGNEAGSGDASSGDASPDCVALKATADALLPAARACCVACQIVQCNMTAMGECCPISVDNPNSTAVQAYEKALSTYKDQCHPACPQASCPMAPTDMCDPSTSECKL